MRAAAGQLGLTFDAPSAPVTPAPASGIAISVQPGASPGTSSFLLRAAPAAPAEEKRTYRFSERVDGLPPEYGKMLDALADLVGPEYVVTLDRIDTVEKIRDAVRAAIKADFASRVVPAQPAPANGVANLESVLGAVLAADGPRAPVPRPARPTIARAKPPVHDEDSPEALGVEIEQNLRAALGHMEAIAEELATHGKAPDTDPAWAVFLPAVEDAVVPPLLLNGAGRWEVEYLAGKATGTHERDCYAVPTTLLPAGVVAVPITQHPLRLPEGAAPADLGDAFSHAMDRALKRGDDEMRVTRRAFADLMGKSVEEVDEMLAEQRAEEERQKTEKRAAKKPMGHGARGAEVRGENGVVQRKLTPRQQELVQGLTVDEQDHVFGPTGHIDDWPALKVVVEAIGGRWHNGRGKGKQGFWTFEEVDPREAIRVALDTGTVLDVLSNDLYETPDSLADELVALADIRPGMRVLEPSAGRGALVRAIRRACPEAQIICVDLLDENVAVLRTQGLEVIPGDFLKVSSVGNISRVVMNPPFSKMADMKHVAHALDLLGPGGRLAAIVSAGARFRAAKPIADVRARLEKMGAVWKDIDDGAFAESGTMARSCMVAVTKR